MRSEHQHHSGVEHPRGRVDGPALLYGGVGLVLAVSMQLIGLFRKGDARLLDGLLDPVFNQQAPGQLPLVLLVMITAVFCFGIAFAVLDSPGMWRRIVLGGTALVVVIAMVPTFAVWNIYFSPFLPVIGIFWSWFCTMMYVSHHRMPCDVSYANATHPANQVLGSVANSRTGGVSRPVDQQTQPREKQVDKKKNKTQDSNAKYKPKAE